VEDAIAGENPFAMQMGAFRIGYHAHRSEFTNVLDYERHRFVPIEK